MTTYKLWKIKEGKLSTWIAWCSKIQNEYYDEAVITLRDEENLTRERNYIINGTHVLFIVDVADGERKPTNMERKLNVQHFEIMQECLELIGTDFVTGYDVIVK